LFSVLYGDQRSIVRRGSTLLLPTQEALAHGPSGIDRRELTLSVVHDVLVGAVEPVRVAVHERDWIDGVLLQIGAKSPLPSAPTQ
jgi:hypothetical protein